MVSETHRVISRLRIITRCFDAVGRRSDSWFVLCCLQIVFLAVGLPGAVSGEDFRGSEELLRVILENRPAPLTNMEIRTTLRVADFGAIPDDGHNDYPAVVAALDAAKKAPGPVQISFNPGVYHFASDTDKLTKKDGALPLFGLKDLVIEGNEAEIVINRAHMCFVYAQGCTNIIVRNFTVDYDPLPFTQGTIVGLDSSTASFTLELDEGFPDPTLPPFSTPGFASFGMAKDPSGSGRMKADCPDHFMITRRVKLDDRKVQLYVQNAAQLKPLERGDRFAINCRAGSICGAFQTENITLENVMAYAVPDCFAVGAELSQLNLLRCKAKLKEGRLIVSGADGIHVQSARVGPWIEGCEFEGLSDDCLNLYTIPNYVLEQTAPDRMKLSFQERVRQGDQLLFFNPRKGEVIKIVTAQSVNADGVTLSEPVEGLMIRPEDGHKLQPPIGSYADKGWKELDHIYNLNTCGNYFVIRNNYFHDGRRFGLFIKASNGLIESNRIERLSGVALSIFNIPHHPEGFWTRNVIINGNRFTNCGDENYKLPIDMRGYYWQWEEISWPFHRNIFFTNNQVEGTQCPLFKMTSVGQMLFSGNTFTVDGRSVPVEAAISQGVGCSRIRILE
jgi:hypothetical protein